MSTYQLKLTYPKIYSCHKITSLVESVNGVRIQHLNFTSREKEMEGVVIFEAADALKGDSVVQLILSKIVVSIDEFRAA